MPLAIDLFCGLGGWAEGFLAEGYDVVGFDLERHDYGTGGYPGQLVIQDVLTLHGSQFKDATVIVASPPCQKYSYMAMPWMRAKHIANWYRESLERTAELNALFNTCFRIQREATEVAGRHIPLIVENVRGTQSWVGRAAWHFGSYYLWGDIPALMPIPRSRAQKINPDGTGHPPGSWFAIADSKNRGAKSNGPKHKRIEEAGIKLQSPGHYRKPGSGPDWYDGGAEAFGSNSIKRKQASAMIAKIPFPLAQHIARSFKP